MQHQLVIAGFGGQGVLLAGQLIAYAGMYEDKHVSWLPSYGPEMRGGTANCVVTVSGAPISSPLADEPDSALIFNLPSLNKFEPMLRQGGTLIVNSSLVNQDVSRDDILTVVVPANGIADELGDIKVANMVMLGAFLAVQPIVRIETVIQALTKKLPRHRLNLLDMNRQAIEKGAALAEESGSTIKRMKI